MGLCPSWLYNAVHGQGLVPVSSSGGINFFIGNNPEASGRFHLPRGIIEKGVSGVSHSGFWQGFRSIAEKAEGRPLSASEVSSFWYRRGFEFWFDAPSEALRLTGRKLLMSLSGGEMSVHHPYEFGKTLVPWLGRLPGFGVVFPFALLGLVLGWRNPTVRWLAAMLGAYWLTMLLFFVADRFRIVMLPLLAVSAAAGMVLFVENLRRGSRTRVWPCMTLMAVAFIVTTNPTYGDRVARKYAASGYNRLGKAEADRGHYRLAMMHFGRSLSLYPSGIAYMNLASLFARKGDFQRAKEIYQKVVHFYPGMRRIALVKLAHIAQLQGDLDEAVRFLQRAAGLMADPSSVEKKIEALEKRMGNRRRRPRDR
ncbi:MAG: hypothetical protein D6806_04995 [Deltaproteobacteria bacterium]|nr:MAG: hypothetical protein D6806_04995 [Deltaproteobacteria bacterium]